MKDRERWREHKLRDFGYKCCNMSMSTVFYLYANTYLNGTYVCICNKIKRLLV